MSFASFPLETLNLSSKQLAACRRAGLSTAGDILLIPPSDLAKKLRTGPVAGLASGQAARQLITTVSALVAPKSTTLSKLVPQDRNAWISTGDAQLDSMLGGGVRVGVITEFVGESAAGKSHLTLMLALAAQVPRLCSSPGGAIVLTSERVLATGRLVELARGLLARTTPEGQDPPPLADLLDNIHTSTVADIDTLEHALAYVLPAMLAARKQDPHSPLLGLGRDSQSDTRPSRPPARGYKPTRILVLDSLTALLRGETETSGAGLAQRSRHLSFVSDKLKSLAVEYNLAIVVVNQVMDVFHRPPPPPAPGRPTPTPLPAMAYSSQARHFSGQSPGVQKEASLGLVWANVVNVRVMLGRTGRRRIMDVDDLLRAPKRTRTSGRGTSRRLIVDDPPENTCALGFELDASKPTLIRRAHLVYSGFAPPAMLDYVITQSGVHTLPGTYRRIDLGPAIRRRDMKMREAARLARAAAAAAARGAVLEEEEPEPTQAGSGDDDDDDVFDDLGDLPPEFWKGLDVYDIDPVAVGVVD